MVFQIILEIPKKTESDTNTKEEQKEVTPTPPRRPTNTMSENGFSGLGTQTKTNRDEQEDDQDSYVMPNSIKVHCIKEMENEIGTKGNITVY